MEDPKEGPICLTRTRNQRSLLLGDEMAFGYMRIGLRFYLHGVKAGLRATVTKRGSRNHIIESKTCTLLFYHSTDLLYYFTDLRIISLFFL